MIGITRLDAEHLEGAAEIERLCFSEPWSKESLKLLTHEGGVGFVAVCDGEIAAYGGMICVLDEGQITNIATHPSYRRKGLGRAVVDALCAYACDNGLAEIFLEVRRSNVPATDLYTKCGFEVIGERKNFYRDPAEDAVLMKKTLRNGEE